MSSLSELQNWLSWVMTDPRGVDAALAGENMKAAREAERTPRLLHEISASDDQERNFRLGIYAEGYFARLLEAIKGDYPLTEKLMGEKLFDLSVAHYLKAYPSRCFSLGEIGESYPKFLREQVIIPIEGYVTCVAAIEQAKVPAFYAPEETTAKGAEMNTLGDNLLEARAVFGASVQMINTEWNLDSILGISGASDDETFQTPHREDSLYVVYQNENLDIEIFCAREWKKQILLALKNGETLNTIFNQDLATTEEEIQQFFTHLQSKNILHDFTERQQ